MLDWSFIPKLNSSLTSRVTHTHTLLIITHIKFILSHTATWPDPAIVGADPFLQKPHTNLSSSRESEQVQGRNKGVEVMGRGGGERDGVLSLIAQNHGKWWRGYRKDDEDDDGAVEGRLSDGPVKNIFTFSSDFYEF